MPTAVFGETMPEEPADAATIDGVDSSDSRQNDDDDDDVPADSSREQDVDGGVEPSMPALPAGEVQRSASSSPAAQCSGKHSKDIECARW